MKPFSILNPIQTPLFANGEKQIDTFSPYCSPPTLSPSERGLRGEALLLLLLFFLPILSFSQTTVTISGTAFDGEDSKLPLTKLMIINKRTGNGIFADADGKFSLSAEPSDTLLFSSIGFLIKKVCIKDSLPAKSYLIQVPMFKLQYTLKEISVFATRDLNDIQSDIDRLSNSINVSTSGGSPFSYLYDLYSRRGRSIIKVAQWEHEDLKRDILKSLFRIYVKHQIIDLSDDEYDAFIKYLNFSDDYIEHASQFELATAIKGKYSTFKYRWK